MCPNPRPARAARGFTLVELLVVIGIIALLISILLPSLNQARQQAKTVQCLSNLRQIGMGCEMYKQQFGYSVPAWVQGTASRKTVMTPDAHGTNIPDGYWQTWPTILHNLKFVTFKTAKATTDDPVMSGVGFCPEGKADFFQSDIPSTTDGPNSPRFAATYRVIGKESADPALPVVIIDTWYGINASGNTSLPNGQNIDNAPSRGVNVTSPTAFSPLVRANRVKNSSLVAFIYDGTYFDPGRTNATTYRINGRHGRNRAYTNILYYDGHAASALRTSLPNAQADFGVTPPARTSPPPVDLAVAKWRID